MRIGERRGREGDGGGAGKGGLGVAVEAGEEKATSGSDTSPDTRETKKGMKAGAPSRGVEADTANTNTLKHTETHIHKHARGCGEVCCG